MRLSVRHVTRYSFATPVARLIQSQRLTPSRCANQQIMEWDVRMDGVLRGAAFRDGAGDWTETVTVHGPLEHFEITVEGEVETQDCAGVLTDHREKVPPSAYLTATDQTRPSQGLRDLAAQALADMADASVLQCAHALSAAVSDNVQYVPGETDHLTPASDVVDGGKGVCQDQTHVLIALAQISGIPARYVTGYLFSASGEDMAEASHAWAELHVPGLGWVGFDASNRCCPDDRYIRLGSGFDAQDASPIRGVVSGGGGETLDVHVKVRDASDPAAAQTQQ